MHVRPLTVGFWMVLGCAVIPAGLELAYSATELNAVMKTSAGQAVPLSIAGELLSRLGLVVLFLSQGFIVWVTWVRPSARLGGPSFLRRAERDINADEHSDVARGTEELLELRSLAQDRVARSHSRAVWFATRIGVLALLAFCAGIVMAPPVFGPGVLAEATTQVFRYLGVGLVLIAAFGVVRGWRRTSDDVRAQAFLDRTASVSEEHA